MSGQLRALGIFLCSVSMVGLLGCESDEDNSILQAQECFNKVSSTVEASACLNFISNINSPEANLLKCGITLYVGGLSSSKIVSAFDAYEAAPDNQKEATLIANLSLTSNTVADNAYNFCKAANAPGMLYIAGLIRLGTYMDTVSGGTNPDDLVTDCRDDPTNCATPEIGQMLIDVGGLYCIGEAATSDVCVALNSSIAAHPGDPAAVINQFLNQINY